MRASTASGPQIVTTDDNVVLDVADRTFDFIKVVVRTGYKDALVLPSGCRNVTIKRLELETWSADGIKVQNAGTPAHHVTIQGGWLRGYAIYDPSVHQDGIQTMGGHDLTFSNVAWDFVGGGGGCWFIAHGGSGVEIPNRMTFNKCAVGPSHPNCARFPSGTGHVMRDCLLYRPYSGRQALIANNNLTQTGTVIRAAAPIETAWKACLDYVGTGNVPPPEPGPEPEPEPGDCDACESELAATKALLASSRAEAQRLNAALQLAEQKEAEVDALLAEVSAMDIVPG